MKEKKLPKNLHIWKISRKLIGEMGPGGSMFHKWIEGCNSGRGAV